MSARSARSLALVTLVLAVAAGTEAGAMVTLGQIDTFSSGTSAFWTGGSGPVVLDNGGPMGTGDRYLETTADGSGSGGKLSIYNREQWLGDFITAGVTAVSMDLKNFTTQPLNMRIAFKTGGGPTAPGFSYTTPFIVPADGQWHHAVFTLSSASFTQIGAPGTFASVVGGLSQEFRLLHSTTPSLTGTNIVGRFGVDNIAAIPAPSAGVLLGLGLAASGRRRRPAR